MLRLYVDLKMVKYEIFSVSGEYVRICYLSPLSICQSQVEGRIDDTAHLQKSLQHRNQVEVDIPAEFLKNPALANLNCSSCSQVLKKVS